MGGPCHGRAGAGVVPSPTTSPSFRPGGMASARVLDGPSGRPAARRRLSGTGNIHSGRMIVAYVLRGCSSVQLHTFFQLPLEAYPATDGSRTQRALHALLFDPRDGLIAVMLEREAAEQLERRGGELHFLDLLPPFHANRPR